MISLRRVIDQATRTLAAAGVESPRVDAEVLTAHVLDIPRGRLPLVPELTPAQLDRLLDLVSRRARRQPLQHLIGTAPFRRLQVAVGPGVFVPRPETELLVEWALRTLTEPGPVVVDLCSGSGVIALAVADERPQATVYAVERDPVALRWLRRNVVSGGGRVEVVAGDATDPATLSTLDGRVDLVLCNPPYVPDGAAVAPEVARYEPPGAVFAGPDGLKVVPGVVRRAADLLRPGGWLGIEHDDSHGRAVPDLLVGAGAFEAIEEHRDLAGRPRFATARRVLQIPAA